jgi:hypothetical protein
MEQEEDFGTSAATDRPTDEKCRNEEEEKQRKGI